MTYQYKFVPRSEEEEVPTIQDKFVDIYYEQDFSQDCVTKFHLACESFMEQYKLQPPYKNYSSFTTMMNKRHREGKK